MTYVLLLLFCIVLFEMFVWLEIVKDAKAIIARSHESMRVLRSAELGDDEKESFMRRGSAEIFKATFRFSMKLLAVGLVLYLFFLLIVALFSDLKEAMLKSLFSPAVIAMLTAGTMCYAWVRKAILARR